MSGFNHIPLGAQIPGGLVPNASGVPSSGVQQTINAPHKQHQQMQEAARINKAKMEGQMWGAAKQFEMHGAGAYNQQHMNQHMHMGQMQMNPQMMHMQAHLHAQQMMQHQHWHQHQQELKFQPDFRKFFAIFEEKFDDFEAILTFWVRNLQKSSSENLFENLKSGSENLKL